MVDTGVSREVFAVSLAAMAMPLGAALPANTRDFCAEVRTMPDQLVSLPEATGPLHERAFTRAAELELQPGDRIALVSGAAVATLSELVDGLLAPLDGGRQRSVDQEPGSDIVRLTMGSRAGHRGRGCGAGGVTFHRRFGTWA